MSRRMGSWSVRVECRGCRWRFRVLGLFGELMCESAFVYTTKDKAQRAATKRKAELCRLDAKVEMIRRRKREAEKSNFNDWKQ